MKKIKTKNKGFTLIELMIAIGVITILPVASYMLYKVANENNQSDVEFKRLSQVFKEINETTATIGIPSNINKDNLYTISNGLESSIGLYAVNTPNPQVLNFVYKDLDSKTCSNLTNSMVNSADYVSAIVNGESIENRDNISSVVNRCKLNKNDVTIVLNKFINTEIVSVVTPNPKSVPTVIDVYNPPYVATPNMPPPFTNGILPPTMPNINVTTTTPPTSIPNAPSLPGPGPGGGPVQTVPHGPPPPPIPAPPPILPPIKPPSPFYAFPVTSCTNTAYDQVLAQSVCVQQNRVTTPECPEHTTSNYIDPGKYPVNTTWKRDWKYEAVVFYYPIPPEVCNRAYGPTYDIKGVFIGNTTPIYNCYTPPPPNPATYTKNKVTFTTGWYSLGTPAIDPAGFCTEEVYPEYKR